MSLFTTNKGLRRHLSAKGADTEIRDMNIQIKKQR